MTNTDLHHLAVRFCDEDAMTRDLTADGATEYRYFLFRFLARVAESERQRQLAEVLQFEKREEESNAGGNAS